MRRPRHPLVALAATVAVLGTQPAILCGLACLANHTPAGSLTHPHHDSPDTPCATGGVRSVEGIALAVHPAGVALPDWMPFALPSFTTHRHAPASPPAFVPPLHPDNPDPPPRV